MLTQLAFLFAASLAGQAFATAEPNPRTAPLAAGHPHCLYVSAPLDRRVAGLISRMTLEKKALALNHNGPDVERIGLRSDKWNQCLNGVQWSRSTTLFPTYIALAATWKNRQHFRTDDGLVPWIAEVLGSTDKYLGVFNTRDAPEEAAVAVTLADLGFTGAVSIRDLWQRKDFDSVQKEFALKVPDHGACLSRLNLAS